MGTIEAYGSTIINSHNDNCRQIDWSDWIQMTPAQQAAVVNGVIVNVPSVEGNIKAELMQVLWTNPNPTASFAAQNINLSSNDYDILIFVGYYSTSYTQWNISVAASKGSGAILQFSFSGTDFLRTITRVNDTSFNFADGQKCDPTVYVDNTVCVPTVIYGLKKSVSISFDAIASDVSTSADKCMLSDGVTSVESKISSIQPNYSNVIATLTTAGSSYTCTSDGYLIGTINGVSTGWASIREGSQSSYFLALNTDTTGNAPSAVCIPFKKGNTIMLGGQGTYNLAFTGALS